jgi:hypothetical protein
LGETRGTDLVDSNRPVGTSNEGIALPTAIPDPVCPINRRLEIDFILLPRSWTPPLSTKEQASNKSILDTVVCPYDIGHLGLL